MIIVVFVVLFNRYNCPYNNRHVLVFVVVIVIIIIVLVIVILLIVSITKFSILIGSPGAYSSIIGA